MVNYNEMSEELIKELEFTVADMQELADAKNKPIEFDEDCPEVTEAMAIKFKRVNPPMETLYK